MSDGYADEYEYEYDEELDDELHGEEEIRTWRSGLAVGLLAMLPLLVAYECSAGARRSTAELLLLRAFAPLGSHQDVARWVLLAVMTSIAGTYALRASRALGPALGRIAAEGMLGALVLGPVLVGLLHLLGVAPPTLTDPEGIPTPARAAFVFGAAAWEELLFRVAAYSALYLLARRFVHFLGAGERVSDGFGELIGLTGSAVLFAGAHLARFTGWLGPGGEPYDASVFTWRLLAGILLGLVFRWRGPGVAAWTHGSFNLALVLGAGPDVFLSS